MATDSPERTDRLTYLKIMQHDGPGLQVFIYFLIGFPRDPSTSLEGLWNFLAPKYSIFLLTLNRVAMASDP